MTVTVHGVTPTTYSTTAATPTTWPLASAITSTTSSNTGDVVTEAANAGSDTVAAFVNYTLPANNTVEVLNMIGGG